MINEQHRNYIHNEEYKQKIAEIIEEKNEKNSISKRGFFSLNGVCTQKRLWMNFLVFILVYAIYIFYSQFLHFDIYLQSFLDLFVLFFFGIFFWLWNFHLSCLLIQRMREVGYNPWILLIPIIGDVIELFLFTETTYKNQINNKYLNKIINFEWLFRILLIIRSFRILFVDYVIINFIL